MSETLDMIEEPTMNEALLVQQTMLAYAAIRKAMNSAPLMHGPRLGARALPNDILSRPYVVTFRDAGVLREALLPFIGNTRADALITKVRAQVGEANRHNIVPLLGLQVLRAKEGGHAFLPFVVSPEVDRGNPGVLTSDTFELEPVHSIVESSRVH